MKKSIRYTFFTSVAAVLISSIVIIGLIQSYLAITYFRDEKQSLLDAVVDGVVYGIKEGELDITADNRNTLSYMAHTASATVFTVDSEGMVSFCTDTDMLPVGSRVDDELLREVEKEGRYNALGTLSGLFEKNQYTAANAVIPPSGEIVGYIFAVTDASSLTVYLSDLASSFLLSAALVLLVASIVGLVLTNRLLVPIHRITDAAQQFGEGDYSVRVPVEGDNELSQLAVTFNEMANSLEATDISRRSFMGNIAHELRTPMTTIKGFIDGMLDGTIPEELQPKYLGIVSEEVGRLARLTKNMLDVSKLEAGEYVPQTTVFNIWEPMLSVLLSSEQRLEDAKVDVLGLEDMKAVYVQGDSDFVHQVLFNLTDNALKFAGENGAITVGVNAGKGYAEIRIKNTGAGIAEEVLPHLFDRFYKEDQSRGLNAKGSGLGLHICKVLVNLMGGKIWAESQQQAQDGTDGWTQFCFTLPMAPPKTVAAMQKEQPLLGELQIQEQDYFEKPLLDDENI